MSVWLKNREHSGAHDPARSIIETLALHGEHSGAGSGSEAWASGPSLRRVSPVDLQPLGVVRSASAEDCSRAIEQATTAFKVWGMVPAPRRGEVVRQIGEMLRRHKKELAEIISLEVGKIRAEAEGEVQEMIDMADFAVGQSRMLYGATMPSERPGHRIYEQWHPLGPVGSDHRLQFPGGGLFDTGTYVAPCIAEARADMPIVQEEIFAPILYLIRFRTLEEAVAHLNAVSQGLSSAIFTNHLLEAEAFLSASGSDCGIANVNIGTSGPKSAEPSAGKKTPEEDAKPARTHGRPICDVRLSPSTGRGSCRWPRESNLNQCEQKEGGGLLSYEQGGSS